MPMKWKVFGAAVTALPFITIAICIAAAVDLYR